MLEEHNQPAPNRGQQEQRRVDPRHRPAQRTRREEEQCGDEEQVDREPEHGDSRIACGRLLLGRLGRLL
jgi:hypothetical protein